MATVSVVIPTHNRADLIGEAIRSVLAQTFQDFDVHIVDDGSTDNTKDVVDSLDDGRLHYFWQENSGLPADARNVGILRSGGEFVAFLDSDDAWFPDKLEHQVSAMRANPNCGIVASNYKCMGDHPLHDQITMRDNIPAGKVFEALLHANFIGTSMVMVRRSALEKVGAFHTDPSIRCAEDFDLWLRIAYHFEFEPIREVGGVYRIHSLNLAKGGASLDSIFAPIRVVERIDKMYRLPKKLMRSALSEHYARQAFHFLRAGDPQSFRQSIRHGARHRVTAKHIGLLLGHALLGTGGLIRFFDFIRHWGLNPSSSHVR